MIQTPVAVGMCAFCHSPNVPERLGGSKWRCNVCRQTYYFHICPAGGYEAKDLAEPHCDRCGAKLA